MRLAADPNARGRVGWQATCTAFGVSPKAVLIALC
jgi:hypothetical protein